MVGISMLGPDRLPPGPHRELVEALHGLYQGAGTPGLRRISKAVNDNDEFRDTVSHEKVSAMLKGKGLPGWFKLEPVVRVLVAWHTPALDADAETARFLGLWQAAQRCEADTESGPSSRREAARESGQNTGSGSPAADGDTIDAARAIGAEIAAQAQSDRQSESERGYRDGVKFARDLPTWREFERLAKVDFDIAAWIKPKADQWRRIAAGMDTHTTDIPKLTWDAARYLGRLADPAGTDQFSFIPTKEYVNGFGSGLRAVWEAAQSEERSNRATADHNTDFPDRAELEASPPSHRVVNSLVRLPQGRAELGVDDVEPADRPLFPRVYISYSRDSISHIEEVENLAIFLRDAFSIDVSIDRWAGSQRRNWRKWAIERMEAADYIICVASPHYKTFVDCPGDPSIGKSCRLEAGIMQDLLARDQDGYTRRILPVVLPRCCPADIPDFLDPQWTTFFPVDSLTLEGTAVLISAISDGLHWRTRG
ncbi:TIR domain-containing protein [Amycolatopsis sp. H6(2020)]|nr:TIR domain-containing protein [Amycolatopsis sp. H6(2020)]